MSLNFPFICVLRFFSFRATPLPNYSRLVRVYCTCPKGFQVEELINSSKQSINGPNLWAWNLLTTKLIYGMKALKL
jgi:hypothetical protein